MQSDKSRQNGHATERILLIDDDSSVLESIRQILSAEGYEVVAHQDPEAACREIKNGRWDIILTDLKMPGVDGLEVLRKAREEDENVCVILFTGHATVETAIEALNMGASDYLIKPVSIDHLQSSLKRAQERQFLESSRRNLLETLEESNRQLSSRFEEINALYDASVSLSSTSDTRALLENILALSAKVTHATVGSVMLIDQSGKYLTIAAAQGLEAQIVHDVRQPVGESIAGFVAQSGDPLLIENVEKDSRFKRKSGSRYGNASLICVPLKVGHKILGVINLSRKTDGGVFSESDLRLAIMFASQAAVVINDARQFDEISRQLTEFIALHELTDKMKFVTSQKDMLELVFETLSKLIPLEFCIWLQNDSRSQTLKAVGAFGKEMEYSDSGNIVYGDEKVSDPVIRGVTLERIESADKGDLEDYILECLPRIGLGCDKTDAFMVAPVIRDGAVTYLFCFGTSYLDRYNAHERSLADIVVSQSASLYEKEKAMLNASRLLTMGNMISEISHDLRKPLTAIKGSIGLLRKEIGASASEDSLQLTRLIEEESHRLNELVSELVDFSKPHKYEAENTDLRRLAIRALELVAPDLEKRNITTNLSFSDTNWEVIVNKNQVFEVLLNLLMNAVDAMPDGGELNVSGKIDRPEFKNSDYLALSIRDTGAGIKKEDLAKLFDRYFTTKESGTGLGLAVVERIMSAHNGTISVDSEEGSGATFKLYFPLEENTSPG
jgi:two-component system, NtrC family, sensor histidine kinase HydH